MIKLYSPNNEIELAFIKGIFESEEIPFFIHNDHYGSLEIGPRIDLLNAKTIFVHEDFEATARELISEYLKNTQSQSNDDEYQTNYSFSDKIRIVFETLIFGWFMPGRRWPKKRRKAE